MISQRQANILDFEKIPTAQIGAYIEWGLPKLQLLLNAELVNLINLHNELFNKTDPIGIYKIKFKKRFPCK